MSFLVDEKGDDPACLGSLFETSDSDSENEAPTNTANAIPTIIIKPSKATLEDSVCLNVKGGCSSSSNSTAISHYVTLSGHNTSIDLVQFNDGVEDRLEGTGGVCWGCAPALCSVLATSNTEAISETFRSTNFSGKLILELGAGTGAVGLWIASHWPTATVILTDLAEAQDLLRRNIALNGLEGRCFAAELPFGSSVDTLFNKSGPSNGSEGIDGLRGRRIDVLIASDCTYSYMAKFSWEPLALTILSAATYCPESEKLHTRTATGEEVQCSTQTTDLWLAHQERYGANAKAVKPLFDFLAEASVSESHSNTTCDKPISSFVEVIHPQIGEGSQFYGEEYPLRVFHAALPRNSTVPLPTEDK